MSLMLGCSSDKPWYVTVCPSGQTWTLINAVFINCNQTSAEFSVDQTARPQCIIDLLCVLV